MRWGEVDQPESFRNNSVVEIQATRSASDGVLSSASDSAAVGGSHGAEDGARRTTATVPVPGADGAAIVLATARRSVTPAQNRVAQSLLMDGPASAVELAERLEITPAGVRRHIDALVSDGFVAGGDRPAYGPSPSRGRGRPPRIYSLTDEGRDVFDQAYDDLAVAALRFLQKQIGETGIEGFAEQRGREFEQRYSPRVSAAGPDRSDRIEALATALTEDGFAAAMVSEGSATGFQICQHNCPVAHVAEQFPVLCEKETEAMQRLLGGTVTRLATIAHGDGVCTALVMGQPPTGLPSEGSRTLRSDDYRADDPTPDSVPVREVQAGIHRGDDRRPELTLSGQGSASR